MGMTRLGKIVALAVVVGGLALIATAFQGLVQVDGTLQAATRDMRKQEREHVIQVKYRVGPDCPAGATRRL